MNTQLSLILEQLGCSNLKKIEPVSGGCINQCFKVTCSDGRYFLKTYTSAPARFFKAEAEGLDAIAATGTIRTPNVIAYNQNALLLEYLPPSQPSFGYWVKLAEHLAQMHQKTVPCFGFESDNYCGLTPQPNPTTDNGYHFFKTHRLLYQADLAMEQSLLDKKDYERLEQIADNLEDWIPDQPPCLIHGDLWSGNIYCSEDEPVLLDPACYWGWAEADLAMTQLFGGFSESFYSSYLAANGKVRGWQQRSDLYNLYHLLNHLNLFGTSYLSQVRSVMQSYLP